MVFLQSPKCDPEFSFRFEFFVKGLVYFSVDKPHISHRLVVAGHLSDPRGGHVGGHDRRFSTGKNISPMGVAVQASAIGESDSNRAVVSN